MSSQVTVNEGHLIPYSNLSRTRSNAGPKLAFSAAILPKMTQNVRKPVLYFSVLGNRAVQQNFGAWHEEYEASAALCCANLVRDSSCESYMVVGRIGQTHTAPKRPGTGRPTMKLARATCGIFLVV